MAWHAPGQPTPQTSGFVQYLEELRAHPARLVVALVATLVAIAVLLIFLPSTWAAYATDGDGDGRADPNSLPDAAAGASRLLCANGGNHPSGLSDALYSYNHSWAYVAQVEAAAHRLARGRSPA